MPSPVCCSPNFQQSLYGDVQSVEIVRDRSELVHFRFGSKRESLDVALLIVAIVFLGFDRFICGYSKALFSVDCGSSVHAFTPLAATF